MTHNTSEYTGIPVDPDMLEYDPESFFNMSYPRFKNIPMELKICNSWVLWRSIDRGSEKPTKIPFSAKGHQASVIDKTHHSSYFDVMKAYHDSMTDEDPYSGIGFVLTKDDPFVFIDLDETDIPTNIELQNKILNEFKDTYIEKSPSGNGYHIICRGEILSGKRRYSCEIYDNERYMTMTGNVVSNRSVSGEMQEKVVKLWGILKGDSKETTTVKTSDQTIDDQTVLDRAARAINGDLFKSLWEGKWEETGRYTTQKQSGADQALINMLYFYSRNDEQVARLFRQSGLGQREKALRDDYIKRTLANAHNLDGLSLTHEECNALAEKFKEKMKEKSEYKTWDEVPYGYGEVVYPPGLVGEVAEYLERQAPCPVKVYCLAGALGFMAGLAGRAYSSGDASLNVYSIVIGESGSGKELMVRGISRMYRYIIDGFKDKGGIFNPMGPSGISSSSALAKYIEQNNSVCSVIPEFGYIFKSMRSEGGNDHMEGLRNKLLDLYSKSGADSETGEAVFSNKEENIKSIKNPAFSMICETVGNKFWPHVSSSVIKDGFLPRFLVFEYGGKQLNQRMRTEKAIDNAFGHKLLWLAQCCKELSGSDIVREIRFTNDAESEHVNHTTKLRNIENRVLGKEYDKNGDFMNLNFDKMDSMEMEAFGALYNRLALNIQKVAGLIAVGINPKDPCIDMPTLLYARSVVMNCADNIIRRCINQDAAIESLEKKQLDETKRTIAKYLGMTEADLKRAKIDPKMKENGHIPYAFLLTRTHSVQCFKMDRIGAKNALARAIDSLEKMEIIEILAEGYTRDHYNTKQKIYRIHNLDAIRSVLNQGRA